MKTKYRMDASLKNFIYTELTNYEVYKTRLQELEKNIIEESPSLDASGSSKTNKISSSVESKIIKLDSNNDINSLKLHISHIKKAYSKLKDWERPIAESIFNLGHTQIYCKMHSPYIEKDTYYNVRNKLIYYTAIEYGYTDRIRFFVEKEKNK